MSVFSGSAVESMSAVSMIDKLARAFSRNYPRANFQDNWAYHPHLRMPCRLIRMHRWLKRSKHPWSRQYSRFDGGGRIKTPSSTLTMSSRCFLARLAPTLQTKVLPKLSHLTLGQRRAGLWFLNELLIVFGLDRTLGLVSSWG